MSRRYAFFLFGNRAGGALMIRRGLWLGVFHYDVVCNGNHLGGHDVGGLGGLSRLSEVDVQD